MRRQSFGNLLKLACLLPALLLGACAGPIAATEPHKRTVDVIVKMAGVDFWQVVKQGADSAGREFDVDIRFDSPDAEDDVDGQIALVKASIARRADAIVLAAADYVRLADVAEEASAAGIPVVVIDSALESKHVSSFIATDNREAGVRVGEQVLALSGGDCDLAIMNFVKSSAPAELREAGVMDVVGKNAGIRLVQTLYCDSDTALAESMTRELLAAHPEIDMIAGLNAMGAIGVARAVHDIGLDGRVRIVAMDNASEEIDFLESGTIQALVVQNPFAMGYLGVKTALDVMAGYGVEPVIDTGSTVITPENMYTPENQKLLFPFVDGGD